MVYAFNPSTQVAKAARSLCKVEIHLVYREFQGSQGYIERPCFKKRPKQYASPGRELGSP